MLTRRRRRAEFVVLLLLLGLAIPLSAPRASADPGCQDVLLVFARGSGETFDRAEASKFFQTVEKNVGKTARVDQVELGNLDGNKVVDAGEYPAVGFPDWFSPDPREGFLGGYDKSESTGVTELVSFLNLRTVKCPQESFVLSGYSQGAHVVGDALSGLSSAAAAHVAFVALFGDPRFNPGGSLSRLFGGKAPWARGNSRWYQSGGILGPRDPYVPTAFENKTGSWCDKQDGICTGNLFRVADDAHKQYPDSEIPQAANEISVRLKTFRPDLADDLTVTPLPVSSRPTPNVDVAFVVDSTGSMGDDIDAAKESITGITGQVFGLATSPRVALVDYKDLGDAYQARVDSPFTANRAAFAEAVNGLSAAGGGDTPESVYAGLMAAFGLDWRSGALKSAILIGDAPAKDPEPGTNNTLVQVLKTAFELDPVVINPIVIGGDSDTTASFKQLADGSKGKLFAADNAGDVVDAIKEALDAFSLAPVAQADGPYTAAPSDEIRFTGAGSFDPDSAIVKYAWDFNNDGTVDEEGPSPVVLHTYGKSYKGLAALTVTAADGGTNTTTADVDVAPGKTPPKPPTAPRNVSGEAAATTSVSLSWKAPADSGDGPVGAYRVYDQDGTLVGVFNADITHIQIPGLPTNKEIHFGVEALNEFGISPRTTSNPVMLAPGGGTTTTSRPTTSSSTSTSTTTQAPGSTSVQPPTSALGARRPPGKLPFTGSNLALLAAFAALLIGAGSLLAWMTRARRGKT